ncbi:MAG: ATP-binding protein [Methanomassiliicoccaceae archaeon]|nr:ATP-binding protein [Methanomassiliicoccaceae archaeon]MCL2148970.1 ATP-binding protein [Methanomassiliicoccaceae archaeon]
MLRRKVADQLMDWKNDPDKKSLLVRGARQVGKTYSINDFGEKNYGTYVYINFVKNPEYATIFAGDLDVDAVLRRMSAFFPKARFTPGDTLIFLDEIQKCPDARVAFKFFTMDKRYDVIGSGSLMGVMYTEASSYPVGYEDSIDMHSLDFEEFLWAMDVREDIIGEVKKSLVEKRPIDAVFLNRFNEFFRWHMVVGGMPEVVETFKKTNHFGKVRTAQRNIIRTYIDDITKYAPAVMKNKILSIFHTIPVQLAGRNKRFVFADVDDSGGGRYDKYGNSIMWLYEAGIINLCYNLTEPAIPLLSRRKNNSFKVYMNDTGLLMGMMEEGLARGILNSDLDVNNGAMMENIVAEMLVKEGYELNYFEKNGTLEIDFVLNLGGAVTAVEVKSGDDKQSKSLGVVMSKTYKVKRGIKLQGTNVVIDDKGIERYPIFAAAFMRSMNEETWDTKAVSKALDGMR